MNVGVSVLVLTLNEEATLPACLKGACWSDDIVVLDSYSRDTTVEIAKQLGARVYQRVFDDFAGQRNYALNEIPFKHDWVLHLDADEIVTPALRSEIERAVASERYDAWRLAPKMMFMGRWLRYSGLYPTYQMRLGRRERFRFKQVGHGQRGDLPPERVGTLQEPYVHYSFSKGLADWFDRHNRYSSAEALEAVRVLNGEGGLRWQDLWAKDLTRRQWALKAVSMRLPFRPLLRFLYMYVLRGGFLDGRAGWTYCRMLSMYEYMIVLKTRELLDQERRQRGGTDGGA